jgi:hypothetical protein
MQKPHGKFRKQAMFERKGLDSIPFLSNIGKRCPSFPGGEVHEEHLHIF